MKVTSLPFIPFRLRQSLWTLVERLFNARSIGHLHQVETLGRRAIHNSSDSESRKKLHLCANIDLDFNCTG